MLRRFARIALVLMVSAPVLPGSSASAAAPWSLPVPEVSIALGYGAAYAGCTHRGVDLRAEAGESVCAPVEGTVSFAGAVPADGGGTVQAVTIETSEGLRVSLMPLAESCVSQGATVRAGEQVGVCAERGDSSTQATHMHLSLRRGETYLDPTGLLPAPAATSCQPEASPAQTAASTPASTTSPGMPTSPAAAPIPAAATLAAPMAQAEPAVAATTAAAASQHSFRMPRDAQEVRQLMLHSAQAPGIRGIRLPSAGAAPSALLLALALAAMVAVLAVRTLPRHALDRT